MGVCYRATGRRQKTQSSISSSRIVRFPLDASIDPRASLRQGGTLAVALAQAIVVLKIGEIRNSISRLDKPLP